MSRSTVFEFKAIPPSETARATQRAVDIMNGRRESPLALEDGVLTHIATACGGDVRKAINAVELLFSAAEGDTITLADAKAITQRSAKRYDREREEHYDKLSSLM